jgi:hypothetical protein
VWRRDSQNQKVLVANPHHAIFAVLFKECRVGQGVKTPPFHGGITGSNPVRGTLSSLLLMGFFLYNSIPSFLSGDKTNAALFQRTARLLFFTPKKGVTEEYLVPIPDTSIEVIFPYLSSFLPNKPIAEK